MNPKVLLLSIPLEEWVAGHYVPAAATEAVVLAGQMSLDDCRLDETILRQVDLTVDASAAESAATVTWRQIGRTLEVRVGCKMVAVDGTRQPVAELEGVASARWTLPSDSEVLADTAETVTLAFACLEPMALLAKALQASLGAVEISSRVSPSDALHRNQMAVMEMSAQPPMSSDSASPLNPYALAGIAGQEADLWAHFGFPADVAEPWHREGIGPKLAAQWDDRGFSLSEATQWGTAGASPLEAYECREAEIAPDDFFAASELWVSPFDYVELSCLVPRDQILDWICAIEGHQMLDLTDVGTFLAANLVPWYVEGAPEEFTALEIVRYCSGELIEIEDEEAAIDYEYYDRASMSGESEYD